MAYQTQNRIGRTKFSPNTTKQGFLLEDGDVIYAHTLCGILASNGKLCNLNGNEDAVTAILYADEKLHDGAPAFGDGGVVTTEFSDRVKAGAPYATTVEALSGQIAYLEATGLSAGDEGAECYLVDDHTVTVTDAGDGSTPYVGKIRKVIDATYAEVYIPGLQRD